MFRIEEIPQNRSPTEGISRLRRPDPHRGVSHFSGPVISIGIGWMS